MKKGRNLEKKRVFVKNKEEEYKRDSNEKNDLQIIIPNDENSVFSSFKPKYLDDSFTGNNAIKNKNIKKINEEAEQTKNIITLGRKRKNSKRFFVGHDKFSDDNLIRKIKCVIISQLSSFLNSLLKKIYKFDFEINKKFLKMNQNQIISSKADYNREFLKKSIKEIFSNKISTKYHKYSPYHNKNLVEQLLNEKDEKLKILFTKIFNLTFIECLEHFRGSKFIKELEGMVKMKEICQKFHNERNYFNQFEYFVNNYENIIEVK